MIANTLEMLKIAKQEKKIGDLTYIALGKNKLPESIKEGYKLFKIALCHKKK